MNLHHQLKTNKYLSYKTIFSLLLSVFGIWLGFRKFDFGEFTHAMLEINLFYFFAAMAVVIFTVYLRAWRWKYLVLPIKEVGIFQLFKMEMVGYFGNNVFPLKMGEVLRAYTLGKQEKISGVSSFGTIVNERLMDTLVFAFIIGVSIILFRDFPDWIQKVGRISMAGLLLFGVIVILLNYQKHFMARFWKKLQENHGDKKFFHTLINLVEGLKTLFNTPHILRIILQSLIIWLVTISQYWLLGMCLNISFSISEIMLIFIVTSAMFSIPAAPGYIGTYHAGAINILVFLGVAMAKAQVLAVIMHGVGYLSMTLIGFIYFLKFNVKVNEVDIE